jgi:hypothetical protein
MLKTTSAGLIPCSLAPADGRTFVCDDFDIRYYRDRSKDFFRRGVPLPVCLEHLPLVGLSHHDRLAERTRNTLGHCHDARIAPEGQFQSLVDGTEEDLRVMLQLGAVPRKPSATNWPQWQLAAQISWLCRFLAQERLGDELAAIAGFTTKN